MNPIPENIKRLAFEKKEGEPFTEEEEEICDEWTSGLAPELMKIDLNDPKVWHHLAYYRECEMKKTQVYETVRQRFVRNRPAAKPVIRKIVQYAAAAAVLAAIGPVLWYGLLKDTGAGPKSGVPNKPVITGHVQPAANNAILTLADGTSIDLDGRSPTNIPKQGNSTVIKAGDHLTYIASNAPAGGTATINTLVIPKGRLYELTLADGTKVWLNAGSTLRYPASFAANERRVDLNGEAYFEVTKDDSKPFTLFVNGKEQVKVLGTRFNVKAYASQQNNRVTTTLFEGLVKIPDGPTLKPNQQCIVAGGQSMIKNNVDVNRVLAWKKGYINFEGETIESILQQINRWYKVETRIIGKPGFALVNNVQKSYPLHNVIDILNQTSMNDTCYLKNDTLIVEQNGKTVK